jgi:2-dehydro-3-deoxyphosphogalactonate aldolase
MEALARFHACFAACPLIAIIRGVRPDEVEAIGEAIAKAGIRIIEVPLNSPDPLESIRRLATRLGEKFLVGAGTVLEPQQVATVRDAGGGIIVSPSTKRSVIEAAVGAGLVSVPGYFTPTEAFTGLEAGAHALKLFPAEAASPAVARAQRAVLPQQVPLIVVGGVRPESMAPYLDAGADGFGLGSSLYCPGQSPAEVSAQAAGYVRALNDRI